MPSPLLGAPNGGRAGDGGQAPSGLTISFPVVIVAPTERHLWGVIFVQLTIYYTHDDLHLIKQIEAKAERERRSKSSVILSIIEEYFERDKRLGEILVDLGKLSEDKLIQALETQKKEGNVRPLGEILLAKKLIGEHDLERALFLQGKLRKPEGFTPATK